MQGPLSVLVTGGAGYIGSHAVLALREAGHAVLVIDDLSTGSSAAVPEGVRLVPGDIADEALLHDIMAMHGIDAVMHFAGSTVAPASVRDPLAYYLNNTVKSRTLIAAAAAGGVRHILFSSSAAVYGALQTLPVHEGMPTVPLNPYGRSKLMTEMMLADVAALGGLNACSLRYFNVAGADPKGRAGQSTPSATNLIKVAVEAAVGKRPFVEVYGDDFDTPDGTGVRDYIHVSDLAAAHIRALHLLRSEGTASHTLNCGYGHGFSVLEVLDAVDRVADRKVERRLRPRRPGDPAAMVADSTALRSLTGWQPRYDDLDTIIAHALAWERRSLPI